MVKLVVLYGPPTDADAFEQYYADSHLPLAAKVPGVQRFETGRVLPSPDGGTAPYHRITEIWFEDADSLQRALGSPEGEATAADISNFATGGATMMVVEA